MGESYLHVEIANGVEIQVQRSSVIQVLPRARSSKAASEAPSAA